MDTNNQPLSKLTNAYLAKFFKSKNLPFEEWVIINDGIVHTINNQSIIKLILNARSEEQRLLADTLYELESSKLDINVFLKHLAFEGNLLSHISKH